MGKYLAALLSSRCILSYPILRVLSYPILSYPILSVSPSFVFIAMFSSRGVLPLTAAATIGLSAYYNNSSNRWNLFYAKDKPINAIAILSPHSNSGVAGIIKFQQFPNEATKITGTVTGLSAGCHGFHVHNSGNLTQGCTSAGGHYNPFNKSHGGPNDVERHVGDLGNIHSDGAVAKIDKVDSSIQLSGPYSIIGRSVIVHADKDDLGRGGFEDSKTTGHAGARVACGVIGLDE
jgi:Cu-Zn family superoxide dismutase